MGPGEQFFYMVYRSYKHGMEPKWTYSDLGVVYFRYLEGSKMRGQFLLCPEVFKQVYRSKFPWYEHGEDTKLKLFACAEK